MLDKQYRLEIELELISLRRVLDEIINVLSKSQNSEPDNIMRSALGSYPAQFYKGIENMLSSSSRRKCIQTERAPSS